MSSKCLKRKSLRAVALLGREPGIRVLQDALIDNPLVDLVAVYTHGGLPKKEGAGLRPELGRYINTCKFAGIPLHILDLPDAKNIEHHLPGESFDLIVSLSWRCILSKEALDRPNFGAINIHRGALPKYKGAEPVRRAIEAGDSTVTITAHRMTEELDEGAIISTVSLDIAALPIDTSVDEYAEDIKEKLYPLYAPLVRLAIASFASSCSIGQTTESVE